jgi:hypothetical protein
LTAPAAAVTRPDHAPLAYLSEAVAAAAVVQAADRVGMLAQLDGGPATVAELAAACAISERGARLLLAALAGLGLAEGPGGGAWRAALPDLAGLAGIPRLWAPVRLPGAWRSPPATPPAWSPPSICPRSYPPPAGR